MRFPPAILTVCRPPDALGSADDLFRGIMDRLRASLPNRDKQPIILPPCEEKPRLWWDQESAADRAITGFFRGAVEDVSTGSRGPRKSELWIPLKT